MFYGKKQTYFVTYSMITISYVIPCSILTGMLDIYLDTSPVVIKLVEVIQDYEKGYST